MKTTPFLKMALGLAAAMSSPIPAVADVFQAPYGPGGTWRIYETFTTTLSFKDALADAKAKLDPATGLVSGSLVSVTSAGKETFVRRTLNRLGGDVWIGLTDRTDVALGAEESQLFGTVDDANRINGWKWINGDAYEYYNWNAGEPNDAGGEDGVHFGGGSWNDNKTGFALDEPTSASGSTDETAIGTASFRYIIEFANNAASPFPGIRQGSIFPPNANFNLPLNTAGNWSLREVRDLTLAGNITDSVDLLLSATGTVFQAQVPYLDHTDPTPNPNGGPILTTAPFPFLSDTVDLNDQNILVVAKTRIIIPAVGEYTFQVRSDDGFALRVKGQNWTAMNGAGYIDPLDPTTLAVEFGTGDSNTRGVLNLAAGQYDVEFVNWEGGGDGGSFYEVTASTGNRLNAGEAQWLPLGSTATVAPLNTFNAVRLTADATVANANVRDRGNVLPAMRNIIENAIATGAGNVTSAPRPNLELQEGDNTVPVDLEDTSRFPFNNAIVPVPPPDPPAAPYTDQFITKVTGTFTVDPDANENGSSNELIDITFGLFCDDGASMRIIGQDFEEAQGDGNTTLIDNGGDMTLTADFYTGNTNARGRIALTEGTTYSFVCYMYEGGGGSNFNLRWEIGDSIGGLSAPTALRTAAINDDALNLDSDAIVTNSTNAFPAPFLAQARAILTEAIAQGVAQTATTSIVLVNETAAAQGSGSIKSGAGAAFSGTRSIFPVGAADNFVTRVNGRLVVNNGNETAGETVTVTFGVFADDGADLRIVGQDFVSAGGGGSVADIGGDMGLIADVYTGDTNAFGTIELVEGEYNFEGHQYEGGGGAGYEIWWALGLYTAFDPAVFRVLNTTTGQSLPGNTGIALAAGVAPAPAFNLTAFSFNAGTGVYDLTFESATGKNYAVEYTIGFLPTGAPASAQRWTVVPSKSSVAGAAGTTSVSGNISEIIAPTGQLPDGQTAFFRVRAL